MVGDPSIEPPPGRGAGLKCNGASTSRLASRPIDDSEGPPSYEITSARPPFRVAFPWHLAKFDSLGGFKFDGSPAENGIELCCPRCDGLPMLSEVVLERLAPD
jgi:hypothetical protein